MLSYAPAHAPVMGMTSDQPSGIHPIRVLYGPFWADLRPRGARVASSRRLRPGARAAGRAAAASIELWREPPPLACSDVIEASLSARLRLEIADAIPSRTFF